MGKFKRLAQASWPAWQGCGGTLSAIAKQCQTTYEKEWGGNYCFCLQKGIDHYGTRFQGCIDRPTLDRYNDYVNKHKRCPPDIFKWYAEHEAFWASVDATLNYTHGRTKYRCSPDDVWGTTGKIRDAWVKWRNIMLVCVKTTGADGSR